MPGAIGPVRLVRRSVEIEVRADAAGQDGRWAGGEAGSVVVVAIAVGSEFKVSDLGGESDVGLQRGPRHEIAKLGG